MQYMYNSYKMPPSSGKWLIIFICIIWSVQDTRAAGAEGQLQCLSSTSLSCTEGLVRGLNDSIETRLLFSAKFTCPGTIVGWTVAGRRGEGMQYPKLQVWRENSSHSRYYDKQGRDIQVDAEGSACELITQTCGQIFQCRLKANNRVAVQRDDILGVELPPFNSSGFELFFISVPNTQDHYIFRRQLGSSVRILYDQHSFPQRDDQLLISLEIVQESDNISSQLNSDGRKYSGKASCLIIGATVGGAVGTPLLLLIILLLVILACVIKKSSNKSEITMQNNEAYGESRVTVIFDEMQRMSVLESPFHASEEEDTEYTAIVQ